MAEQLAATTTPTSTKILILASFLIISNSISFTQAGVLRIDEAGSKVAVQRSAALVQLPNNAQPKATAKMETTTAATDTSDTQHSSATEATATSAPTNSSSLTSDDDDHEVTNNMKTAAATTRDVGASITIADREQTAPAPDAMAENQDVVLLPLQNRNLSEAPKSAALLLLSVPKNLEKPKEQEENIEEPEEMSEEGGSMEATATATTTTETESGGTEQATTVWPPEMEDEEENAPAPMAAAAAENDAIQLAAFDQLSSILADQKISPEEKTKNASVSDASASFGPEKTDKQDTAIVERQETQPEVPNDKFGASFLLTEDVEPDFVLLEGEVEQIGSFTHVDSEEHLQPIVESVEIVPSSVDGDVIVSYVHTW